MTPIADIGDARRALRRYLRHAEDALPADQFEKLEVLADSPSPVDAIVRTAELLYFHRAELDDEGRDLAGRLAAFAAVNGWHGMATANRGGLILQAMQRDAEAGSATPEDGDPVPDPALVEEARRAEADAARAQTTT